MYCTLRKRTKPLTKMVYISGAVGNGAFTYNNIHRHLFSYFQIYNETISSAEKEKFVLRKKRRKDVWFWNPQSSAIQNRDDTVSFED
jgi:hypothetical protein